MVLESTMICFDNSDYQRNGDYFPTRLSTQKDGINLLCLTKMRLNPENNVGLMTYADDVEVLATLTSDVGRIFTKMHLIQPKGSINLLTGVRVAHLVLKHRQGKNHKMRIVVFIGSPLEVQIGELIKVAKRLKKEKVNVDVVSYGDHDNNNDMLRHFVNALNGKEGTGSHLISVPRGSALADALLTSPIIQGDDGMGGPVLNTAGFEFGVDPNEDPELALALRVSMEEQRQRQEAERNRAENESTSHISERNRRTGGSELVTTHKTNTVTPVGQIVDNSSSEEAMLQRALAMSTEEDDNMPDFMNMSEEEQIAFAMQMSMREAEIGNSRAAIGLSKDDSKSKGSDPESMDVDFNDILTDSSFMQMVLDNLPGVDEIRPVDEDAKKDKNSKDKSEKNDGSKK